MLWQRIKRHWENRSDLPSWVLVAVVAGILVALTALLLPALGKGGSFTSSFEIMAEVSGTNFAIGIERYRSRPGGFYLSLPNMELEKHDSIPTLEGTLRVLQKAQVVGKYAVTTSCCEGTKFHEPRDLGKVSPLLWLQFDGQRLPQGLRPGQSYEFVFELSALLPNKSRLVQKVWHRPGVSR